MVSEGVDAARIHKQQNGRSWMIDKFVVLTGPRMLTIRFKSRVCTAGQTCFQAHSNP